MKIARKEIETMTAEHRVKEALKHRVSKDYPQSEFGDRFMVYREELKNMKDRSPYTLLITIELSKFKFETQLFPCQHR